MVIIEGHTHMLDAIEHTDFSAANRTPAHFRSALLMHRSGFVTTSSWRENNVCALRSESRPVRPQLRVEWVLTSEGLRMQWSTSGEGGGV